MYEYKALILRVVDGDTVHADVDLGFDSHQLLTLRLSGINAPELSDSEVGAAAKEALTDWIKNAQWRVVIRTTKDRRSSTGGTSPSSSSAGSA